MNKILPIIGLISVSILLGFTVRGLIDRKPVKLWHKVQEVKEKCEANLPKKETCIVTITVRPKNLRLRSI